MPAPLPCPACRGPMERASLPRNYVGEVELDLCYPCRGIWFDHKENIELAPNGVIQLFRLIHEHRDASQGSLSPTAACPRCREKLAPAQDLVRWGRFEFRRCPVGHGRFIAFTQFLIEKGFVRPLSPAEKSTLAARIGIVRCSGCGGPVDISHDANCPHCRTPVSILDPGAVDKALKGYEDAAKGPSGAVARGGVETLARMKLAPASGLQGNGGGSELADLVFSGIEVVVDILSN